MFKSIRVNHFVFLFSFLPFVNFGISLFNSDTQPFYFFTLLFIMIFNLKSYQIQKKEYVILYLAFISTVITFFVGYDFKKSFHLLIIAISLLFFYRNTFNLKLIRIVFIIYIIIFLFWLIAPFEAYTVQSYLVRNINSGVSNSFRGIPVLSTEPGLYAATAIMLCELYIMKLNDNFKLLDYILIGIIFFSIVLSFSGTSIIFLTVFMLFRIRNLKTLIISIILLLVLNNLILYIFPLNRLTILLGFLSFDNISMIFNDSSLMYRISSLGMSFDYFSDHFFGAIGEVNLKQTLQEIYYKKYYNKGLGMTYEYHLVSGFGYSLICSGIITLLFFLAVTRKYMSIKGIVYMSMCMCFSFSLIYPVSLILLVESFKNKYVPKSR